MINPPPRPALRKAPDADVHPVAPVQAVTPPVTRPELRPVVGIGGRTSDTLVARTPKKTKRATLEVKVPKALLKSVKRQAKTRGDSLDDVVSTALQSYLDRA
ncbi:MAG: hypothetical protein E6Q91_00230 [Actinobacteria bacterium]|nr:MAG: hypothetical protein E6Q91_00230 [Actinomycetota bacterium]